MSEYRDFKIELNGKTGEVATTCPQCSATRKNKLAKCLSVNTEKGVWVCFHCGWKGSLKNGQEHAGKKLYARPAPLKAKPATTPFEQEVQRRCIPQAVLDTEGVILVSAWIGAVEDYTDCIAFPYRKCGDLVNVKYRALGQKAFQQVAHCEKIFYRQDSIDRQQVLITEGEWDALSLVVAGFQSVVSVPDGAPAVNVKDYTSKFSYLDQEPDPFAHVQDIILAVDQDEPGVKLRDELARRLGTDRCRFVTWPDGCKDANDTLRLHGVQVVRECITQAKPFPVQDAVDVESLIDEVMALYAGGRRTGLSTGWAQVDAVYKVEPGQLTVVTGIPGHGKSEWLDDLMRHLMTLHGWRFAVCSPENWPLSTHLVKLLEKHVGRPFAVGPTQRIGGRELADGLQWLHDRVTFLAPEEQLTIPDVLARAGALVRRRGVQGVILDPFNEFDHTRPRGMTETEYISDMLGLVKRWARKCGVHVWLVAHPQKLYRREDGTYPVPTPYDISGSAHWRNKADNCIAVWRNLDEPEAPVEVHVQKVRFKHCGKIGMAQLIYDRVTGRYADAPIWMNEHEGRTS